MRAPRSPPVATTPRPSRPPGFVIAVVEYDYETATAAFDRSFALSSSSALTLGFSSIVPAWKGDDAMAVDQAARAIRLSPFDPLLHLPNVGLAYAQFAAGRFEEAAADAEALHCERQTRMNRGMPHPSSSTLRPSHWSRRTYRRDARGRSVNKRQTSAHLRLRRWKR